MKKNLIIIFVVLFSINFLNAATLHVGPGQAYESISDAVDAAGVDDTIIVHDSGETPDYQENVDVDVTGLTIEVSVGDEIIVEAQFTNDHVFDVSVNNVTINGFIIYGASNNGYAGIYLNSVSGCVLQNNTSGVSDTEFNYEGIKVENSTYIDILDNFVYHNDNSGIRLISSTYCDITGNNCDTNDNCGISLSSSHYNTVDHNFCDENGWRGIALWSESSNNLIDSNETIANDNTGIILYDSSNNTVIDNTCTNTVYDHGILLYESDFDADNNVIQGNTCSGNDGSGISLDGDNNTIKSNICDNNGSSGIFLNGSRHYIYDNTCTNNYTGIKNQRGDLCVISDNTCTDNDTGIYIDEALGNGANYNTVSNNSCLDNIDSGIESNDCDQNSILFNTVTGNGDGWRAGIYLEDSNYTFVYLNTLENDDDLNADQTSGFYTKWNSPTSLSYNYSGQRFYSMLGNYYSDYSSTDADSDGIGDDEYLGQPGNGFNNDYPLFSYFVDYDVLMWFLNSDMKMYHCDATKAPEEIDITASGSKIFILEDAAVSDTAYPAEAWKGRVFFIDAAPASIDIEIGSSTNGLDFTPGGPNDTVGNGTDYFLTFETDESSFTVNTGNYLALRITNNDAATHQLYTGGAFCYLTSPDESIWLPEPSNHVLSFSADAVSSSQIDVSWTENDGAVIPDGYLIKASTGSITAPVDGTDPADDSDLTDGDGLIHIDHGTSVYSFLNCSPSTTYNFEIYPYTNLGPHIDFKTGDPIPEDDATTLDPEPSNHVLDLTATAMSEFQIDLSWTENDGAQIPAGYLIKGSTAAVVDPVDGVDPADDNDLGDGDGIKHVAYGSSSYTFWSANPSTTYHFKLYPYTNSGDHIDFKTDEPVPADDATTPDAPMLPEIGDLIITEVCGDNVDGVDDNDGFVEIMNVSQKLIDLSMLTVRYFDNGNEWPMETFLWGTVEPGDFIIVTQDIAAFEEQYGFWADYTEMMMPFDGGLDGIEIFFMDMMPLIIDQFNETGAGSSPWSWNTDYTYERDMCGEIGDGSLFASWIENTTSPGTPGEISGTSLGTPVVSIEIVIAGENKIVNLDWESVECADSYNIYSLDEPYGVYDYIDNTTETFWSEIIGEGDEMKFYKVTAVN